MASRGNIQSRQQSVCVKIRLNRPRARVTSAYFGTSGTNPVGKFARNCPCFLIITYLAFVARYSNCPEMRIQSFSCLYSWALARDRGSGLWNVCTPWSRVQEWVTRRGHGCLWRSWKNDPPAIGYQFGSKEKPAKRGLFWGVFFIFHKCSEKEF